jgi:hypothetical protein
MTETTFEIFPMMSIEFDLMFKIIIVFKIIFIIKLNLLLILNATY